MDLYAERIQLNRLLVLRGITALKAKQRLFRVLLDRTVIHLEHARNQSVFRVLLGSCAPIVAFLNRLLRVQKAFTAPLERVPHNPLAAVYLT